MRTMDIDENVPVITREEILIDSSTIEEPLEAGTIFRWQTFGLSIESTIQEIDSPRRIVWSGPAQGITAIHLWTMTPSEEGVILHTEESWDG